MNGEVFGDDGTRTRGLCRDRVRTIVFSATYKNAGTAKVAGRNYKNRKLWVGLWVGNSISLNSAREKNQAPKSKQLATYSIRRINAAQV